MRFSQQRASMGGSAETETEVTEPDSPGPALRLFITPRTEVDALCRLALARYLEGCSIGLAAVADAHFDTPMGGVPTPVASAATLWVRLKAALATLTVVDPACGEGHILIGMLDLLDRLLERADQNLGVDRGPRARRLTILQTNLYGVEAQSATLCRARARLQQAVGGPSPNSSSDTYTHLVQADSLVERDEFHWATHFHHIMESGGFHLVLGNPPFVRHEQIADPLKRLPAGEYKRQAFAAVQSRLHAFQTSGPAEQAPAVPLSRRSDVSVLFTIFGLSLLRPGGVLSFVFPTAAASAQYGEPLWRLLQGAHFDSRMIENMTHRSFVDAAVNTGLLLAWRHTVTGPTPVGRSPSNRSAHPSRNPAGSARIPPYLIAAPTGVAALRSRIEDHCTSLELLGHLRYPIKTGLNCFFYPDAAVRARFQIEPRFLVPVLKSPRDVETLTLARCQIPSLLFHCPFSPAQLRQQSAHGALAYITWGAQQCRPGTGAGTRTSVPWPSVPSLHGRDPWYLVALRPTADLLCSRFLYQRLFFALPESGMPIDQTFYGLELAPWAQERRLVVGALLNSSLAYLMLETHGRTGLGAGVRQYSLHDMANLPIPNPARVEESMIPDLTGAFQRLASRPIRPIAEEVRQHDREELDALVCGALGLRHMDGADARCALSELVERRLHRAGRR